MPLQIAAMPDGNSSFQNSHAMCMTVLKTETSEIQEHHSSPLSQVTQLGAGHGGERADDRHGPPMSRRTAEREGLQQDWRDPSGEINLDF